MDSVRVDKWLWAVRIFKTRSLSTKIVREGKVFINDIKVKASSQVKVGDLVKVKKEGYEFQFLVKDILSKRVGAPIAQQAYDDLTPEEELNKFKDWFIGKGVVERRDKGLGRPTKKERREIEDYKSNFFEDFDLDEFWE